MKKRKIINYALAMTSLFCMGTLASCDFNTGSSNPPIIDNQVEFTLSIHIGDSIITKTVNKNNSVKLSDYIPQIQDVRFDGWYTDADFKTPCTQEEVSVDEVLFEVYAKLSQADVMTLTIVDGDNSKSFSIATNTYVSLSDYQEKKEGYSFDGFYYDEKLTQKVNEDSIKLTSSITLYANYNALEAITVNIYIDGQLNQYDVYKGSIIQLNTYAPDITEDQILAGWYYDAEFTNKAPDRIVVKDNLTLYIDYYDKENITYAIAGINDETIINTIYKNSYVDLTKFEVEKEHFVFDGWYYDADYTQKISNPASVKITEETTYYAKYIENEKILTYIMLPQSGGEYAEVSLGYRYLEDTLSLEDLPLSTNPNYHLEGYYLDANFENKLEAAEYRVSDLINGESIHIYPKYTCTVTVYINYIPTYSEEVLYGTMVSPADYQFACGEEYRFEKFKSLEEFMADRPGTIHIDAYSYIDHILEDTFEYEVVTGGVAITNYTGNNQIVRIPATIDNKPVVKINSGAFDNTLVSVYIPSTVTSIESGAFSKCKKLIEVYNLSSVNLTTSSTGAQYIYKTSETPSNLSMYNDEYIIYNSPQGKMIVGYVGAKPKLTLPITIDGESYSIYRYAFTLNEYIHTLIIPEGIESIGEYAFSDMYNLIRVQLPSTLKTIGTQSFGNCYKLIEVYNNSDLNIKTNSTEHGSVAQYAQTVYPKGSEFSDKFSVVFEDAEYEGKTYEFAYMIYEEGSSRKLLGVSKADVKYDFFGLPETIESENYEIFHHAFYNMDTILSIKIPTSVTSIGDSAFENCYALKEVELNRTAVIGSYAFANCYRLSKVQIPASVREIKNHAFYNCTNLIEVKFEEGALEIIGSYGFANCVSLNTLTIPKTVQIIEEKALYGCSKLESLTIPFVGRSREDKTNFYFGYIFGGSNAQSGTVNISVPTTLKKIHITDDEEIENQAFWKCSSITEVIFSATKKLNTSTFAYCTSLTTLSFDTDCLLESVADDTFYQANKLKTIKCDYYNKVSDSATIQSILDLIDSRGTSAELNTYTEIVSIQNYKIDTTKSLTTEDIVLSDLDFVQSYEIVLASGIILTKDDIDRINGIMDNNILSVTFSNDVKYTSKDGNKYYKDGTYHITIKVADNRKILTQQSEGFTVVAVQES